MIVFNWILVFFLFSNLFSQSITYVNDYSSFSIQCGEKNIEVRERGKVLGVEKVNKNHFVYYVFISEMDETDIGETYIKIINCNKDVILELEVLDNDVVESFNENIFLVANNELTEAISESILKIYEVSTGKNLKNLKIKFEPGDRISSIISIPEKTYIQIKSSSGETYKIKTIDNFSYSVCNTTLSKIGYFTLRKDINNKYVFLTDNNNSVVEYLTKRPNQAFKYLDDEGNEIPVDIEE